MENNSSLIKILIPAVGGQGGGVLTEWLFQAFLQEEYEVQGVGLPGLSQRAGSTIYYLEAYPAMGNENNSIIFSQYPVPGDIDIILSQEFLELGRVLEMGYGSDKTTIVSSTHRIYSTLEKMPVSSGIYSDNNLRKIAYEFSSNFIGINTLELAKQNELDELAINAILLGALGASGSLPIQESTYLKSIAKVGISIENNIKAFQIGWEYVRLIKDADSKSVNQNNTENFVIERTQSLNEATRDIYLKLISETGSKYPERLGEIFAEALYRLIDYQGIWYAREYLNKLDRVFQIDSKFQDTSYKLTELFAKNLALWMSYEDGIRVSQLKIDPGRFERIKQEMQLKENQVFRVIDYIKPDAEEIYGLLPNIFVSPILRLLNKSFVYRFFPQNKKLTFGQTPVTTSFTGNLRLWILSKLRFLRPYSYRYHLEHSLINKYQNSIEKYSQINYDLACLIAQSGNIIKGYGDIRRRTMKTFIRYLDNIIAPLVQFEVNKKDLKKILETATKGLELISESTDGIEKAEKFTRDFLKHKAA